MATETLYFNGVNGSTGEYLVEPRTAEEVAEAIRDSDQQKPLEQGHERHQEELKLREERETQGTYGVAAGIDGSNLAQAGWGIIFAHNADPALLDALKPLLDLRREQARAVKAKRYQEFTRDRGYRPNETKEDFLARHGVMSGNAVDPDYGVPYYLLLIGDPGSIPYRFQYELDIEFAVGRLHFDTLEEYHRYALGVVAVETGKVALPRRVVFFGVRNEGFPESTQLSAEYLVKPLAERLQVTYPGWQVENVPHAQTTRANLSRYLGGAETPALLFTASHGMGFNKGDPRQLPDQGALLCQDWPGRDRWKKEIPPEFYFAARDVSDDAGVLGLLAFHFACYGAGTPQLDDYPYAEVLPYRGGLAANAVNVRPAIADRPFVARLPQRLLAHPRGGALAVIGHIERAWGCSFYLHSPARAQTQVFESVLKLLMEGHPVGQATEYLNQRYAAVSVPLNAELQNIRYGRTIDEAYARKLTNLWTAYNDAGAYVIVGDPAVRLPSKSLSAGSPSRIDLATLSATL
jgi:hypothetical protein